MYNFRTLYDCDFQQKRVLVRVDFNVPMNEHGDVTNDKRIRETLPTIKYLRQQGAMIILLTHIGRPKGRELKLQTDGIAHRLSQLLGMYIKKLDECIGDAVKKEVYSMKPGDVLMLENVRFYKEEGENNNDFARQLATLADFFVQDAFGVCHRANASVTQIAQFIPACSGFVLQKELEGLGTLVKHARKPFVTIIGGAKADKIGVIHNLLPHLDHLLIGGKLANTFLKAAGKNIGASAFDEESLPLATELLKEKDERFLLPVDVVVADKFGADASIKVVSVDAIPFDWMAIDLGPETLRRYTETLKHAATIVWAGPVGAYEIEKFGHGTKYIAGMVAASSAVKIIGGGDSAAAVEHFGFSHHMSLVSTGGGASLELLQGTLLPGISALVENKKLFPELCAV
ncbi:phosphoglycerate kinase [Candidatus Woesearchaeota archaeon]|nr:phosphoglycerate kinase [Candidatus Woesearchaeota archaeon]